jgi:pimeloyl-ACP methyl ester carboxylesterase
MSVGVLAQSPITIEQAKLFVDESTQALAPLIEQANLKNAEVNVVVRKDIPYKHYDGVDQARLRMDLYTSGRNESTVNSALIVYVHGGGWLGGDKASALFKPAEFVPSGYVFASVNYRFRPEASLVEMAQSVADAVGLLRRDASKFDVDPDRIFLMGHSAGAHMVSVLGTNPEFLKNVGVPMKAIRGVISLDTAAYNVPELVESSPFHKLVFDGPQSEWLAVSPIHQIPNNLAKTPFLVFYSEGRSQANTQTIPFVEQLKQSGYPAFLFEAVGRNHEELDKKIGTVDDVATRQIQKFLSEFSQ